MLFALYVRPRRLLIVHLLAISPAMFHCLARKERTVFIYASPNNKQEYFINLFAISLDSFSAW